MYWLVKETQAVIQWQSLIHGIPILTVIYWMPVSQESVNTLHSTIMEGLAAREFLCTSTIYSVHNVYYELTASYYTHTVSASILVLLIMDEILISMILFTVYTMLTVQLEVRGCYASSLRYFIYVFSYAGSATTGLAEHSITPSFSSAQSNLHVLTDIKEGNTESVDTWPKQELLKTHGRYIAILK